MDVVKWNIWNLELHQKQQKCLHLSWYLIFETFTISCVFDTTVLCLEMRYSKEHMTRYYALLLASQMNISSCNMIYPITASLLFGFYWMRKLTSSNFVSAERQIPHHVISHKVMWFSDIPFYDENALESFAIVCFPFLPGRQSSVISLWVHTN